MLSESVREESPTISSVTPPARPHRKLTDDGRRVREVLSYSRRGARFTDRQQRAWDARAADLVIPTDAVDDDGFDLAEHFGRRAPLIVEIGSGVGEATVALAAERPSYDVLALEVWRPGIASTLEALTEAGVSNVRLCAVDAAWFLDQRVAPRGLAELWTFFPDPWPKTRHHKRRLVSPTFASVVASRLAVDGAWRLATDWADYARQMREVLDAEPGLAGGEVERWEDRPVTRFERKGLAAGRPPTDLLYRARG
ncbi:tRNA (guanosine(46)-N7)-methyltransferase TrmB [uncultured Nocardioides sp.]|uniref:tRNA (guanosine(46)-N7)-methyltransferase TrmB n=1 Tax=uncultured Nocardioides sp. TaxID=198441 RepID=UPI0026311A8F|nr:tRNA (guanosine(46)-N7)-methyltransferase TrmB [uncultured Nocardioides sp.]